MVRISALAGVLLILTVAAFALAESPTAVQGAPATTVPSAAAAPEAPAVPAAPAAASGTVTAAQPATPAAPAVSTEVRFWDVAAVVLYVLILGYLGYLGYTRSKTAEEFLVAGRNTHPVIMALSYGATFISTSAIVGFGGVAGNGGMSLLWLTVLNIFVGIFIAFAFLGGPTRRLGHHLGAHTFPELLGKRYDSRFIQTTAGLIIFLFMPVYAAAVLIGGVKFLNIQFGMDMQAGIFLFAVIVAFYVVAGGLRGVMYTDAFQGVLMFVGMVALVIFAYQAAGGFVSAHEALGALSSQIPDPVKAMGIVSFTDMPILGSKFWWILVSSLVMGVGIGVLAQPQLAVRFMTVKSKKELNRACLIGGIFILAITGSAFVVGALSNVYFVKHAGALALKATALASATGKPDAEQIIPLFIKQAMPSWFGVLFFLSLLSAAMSTLSSQFHVMGTAAGRDIFEQLFRRGRTSVDVWTRLITQAGIAITIVITVALAFAYSKSASMVIAKSTAIFFALCASTFLPSFVLGLFWRRMNKTAAIASIMVGFFFTALWLIFVQADTAGAIGILKSLTSPEVAANPKWISSVFQTAPWYWVDALVIALPLSFAVAVTVALSTKPMAEEHVRKCFQSKG